MPPLRAARSALLVITGFAAAPACTSDHRAPNGRPVVRGAPVTVLTAGALARSLAVALDSFAATTGADPRLEPAGSLETVRKLTELGRQADLVALADAELFPELLVPHYASWYVVFARDRMVLAHSARSRHAGEITTTNWTEVVTRDDVEIGRSDPDLDPAGYRALLAGHLAERHYAEAGLAQRLLARAPRRNVRPRSAELAGLLQAGELDYAWMYESSAHSAGLLVLPLPDAVNLGSRAHAALYAAVHVRVAGRARGDTLVVPGRPILFALTIPTDAPHPTAAAELTAFLFSPRGRALLRREGLDLLEQPFMLGTGGPALRGVAAGPPAAMTQ